MNELVKWLKENIGDSITIITPQFERTTKLEYEWKPQTIEQFKSVVNNAPWNILKGLGFGKWDTMNNLIKENIPKPKHNELRKAPTKLLDIDEDVVLFPGEWYDIIPDGFMVTGLYGEQYPFKHGESDDDIRFGCLPYGIRRVL